jgi:hypothetical protein
MSDYWIPISISDYSREGIEKTLDDCHKIKLWALQVLEEQLQETGKTPAIGELKLNLTRFAYRKDIKKTTPRFTQERAAEQALAEFRIGKNTLQEPTRDFDIEARKIWIKYLERYGGISTVYGMLMLEGEWRMALVQQALDNKLTPSELYKAWRSVTLRQEGDRYKIRFNLKKR